MKLTKDLISKAALIFWSSISASLGSLESTIRG